MSNIGAHQLVEDLKSINYKVNRFLSKGFDSSSFLVDQEDYKIISDKMHELSGAILNIVRNNQSLFLEDDFYE